MAVLEDGVVEGLPRSCASAPSITAIFPARGSSSISVRASSTTISVWTHTSPSGCQSTLLLAADQRQQLRHERIDDAKVEREREANRRPAAPGRAASRARPRCARPAGRRVESPAQRRTSPDRASGRSAPPTAARAGRAGCRRRRSWNRRRGARVRSRSARPPKRIEVLVGQRIPADRVDREVAPPGGLLERHVGIAGDGEALVAAARLRLAPRQRDVDRAHLVDGEALSDRLDTAESGEQRQAGARPGRRRPRGRDPSTSWPSSRSRTNPPTTSARPPARDGSRRAMSRASARHRHGLGIAMRLR